MNVPKLRFKEFSGEWEEKKLGEVVFSLDYGMGASAREYDGVNKYIRITDIDEVTHKYLDSDIVSPSGELNDKYVVRANDILFARTGASTGKTYLYREKDGILYFAGFLIRGSVKTEYDSRFIYNQTLTNRYKKWVSIESMRSGQPGINAEQYSDFIVNIPSYNEQVKISQLVTCVDDKIDNQYNKIASLEKQKKALIQKIFSQELRFKDDNGKEFPDWEDSLLGRICVFRRGSFPQPYGLKQWYDEANGNPFVQVVDVGENMLLKSSTKNKISKMAEPYSVFVPKGTLVITLQGSIGRIAKTQYDAFVDRTLLIITDYNVAIDIDYFKYELKNIFDCEKKKAPGGTIKTITKEALSTFGVRIPCIDEQRKIAKFVQCMEEKIKIENQVLEHWQQIKQSLLQLMFV